jgi:predicted phage tail protein
MGLNSSSVIKIVDLLCEGPIDGIEGGKKGVFLDESPMQAQDGEIFLEKDQVSHELRVGWGGQAYLPQAKGKTSNVVNINKEIGSQYKENLDSDGVKVKSREYGHGIEVVQVTDADVDSVDLVFTIPKLFSTAQEGLVKGQLFDAQIFFKVSVQSVGSGGGFVSVKKSAVDTSDQDVKASKNGLFYIEGISTSNYQFTISGIQLAGKAPWNVKVEKYPDLPYRSYKGKISHTQSDAGNIDQDIFRATWDEFEDVDKQTPLESGRGNAFIWTSLIENVNIRTAYPFSACVGMDISTEEFPSLPTRAYLVRGKKVRVPHNAVPRDDGSLEFVGNFNGSLGDAVWTTCPVCIFYNLLINKRFGAGHFVKASNLSWVDLYPLAQYANELVSTPDGNEPRFACNVQVSSQAEAYTVLQDFASVFRGMMYWQSNVIQLTADHGNLDGTDVDPVHIFSNSNVVGGVFSYSGSSLKTRSTSIRVRYSDPDNFYKPNIVVVEDASLISKYGYQVKEVLAFGCTSKYQAKRMGRWMLKTEELDASTVTFSVGLEGALVFPGQVFAIQDELRAATRLSGRISSSTTTTIVADQSITLPSGDNPTLTCVLNDGTIESKAIDTANTSGTTITVSSAFSSAPLVQAIYSISTDNVNEQKFRCLSVADNGDGTFAVVAVEFNDSIYDAAELDEDIEFEDITVIDEKPFKPKDLSIDFQLIEKDGGITNRAIASWAAGEGGFTGSYVVAWRIGEGSYNKFDTTKTSLEVDGIQPGKTFQVKVRAVGIGFPTKKSGFVYKKAVAPDLPTIIGGSKLVENVTNLTVSPINDTQAVLHWQSPAVEKLNNLVAVIRHSNKTDGTGTFANATNLVEVPASANTATVPLLNGEYLIKLKDQTTKKKSITAVSVVLNIPDALPKLLIETRREDQDTPPFQGLQQNVTYDSGYDGLILDTTELVDGKFSGEYEFASVKTLPGKFQVTLDRTLESRGLYPNDTIDSRSALVDTWADWDGTSPEETSSEIYFRVSDEVPTDDELLLEASPDIFLLEDGDKLLLESSITFTSEWTVLNKSTFVGRSFQFKAELESDQPDETPLVDELGYVMSIPSRTENSATIASGAGAKAVTFTTAFYEAPTVGITAFNLASGDYYELTSVTRTGFTVHFKNSSNSSVDRNFQYVAAGFGSEQT